LIPLSDIDRRPLRFPVITALIIGINVVTFFLELINGEAFIIRWSFIPSEIASGKNFITILTAMFIHGGWLHILGNMIYLWAFGPEIEDILGRLRYIVFYFSGGIVASIAQVAINPESTVPSLGASGAIAAVMGAFLITFPHDRIRTIIFLGWFVTIPLIPAIFLVGFWFLIQLFSEVGTLIHRNGEGGGIAYMSHVGGFVFGMVFARLFKFRHRHDNKRLI
jgi:membrane associated rhomboid family serine protease